MYIFLIAVGMLINNNYTHVCKFYKPEGPVLWHTSKVRTLLRAWGFMKFVDSVVHAYNCFRLYLQYNLVLLFAIYKSLYDSWTQQYKRLR